MDMRYVIALSEQAWTLTDVRQKIMQTEEQLNEHLIKRMVVNGPRNFEHWNKEARAQVIKLARIRMTRGNKPPPAKLFFALLFEGPFGVNLVRHYSSMVSEIEDTYGEYMDVPAIMQQLDPLTKRFLSFHERLAVWLAMGHNVEDKVRLRADIDKLLASL